MIKLKNLLAESKSVNEIKNGRVGDYFVQKAGSDTVNYGVIIDELVNGAFKVVMFSVRDGKVRGNAKVSSTKGWYPEPKKISKDEIPDKVLSKIEKKSRKYESVTESKYRGHVLADVIDDILEEEGFNSYITRVEDSKMNNSLYLYMNTRDTKPTEKVMDTLKEKYGVDRVDYSKQDAAVVVPSGTLMEATHKTYFQSFSGAAEAAAELAEKEGYQIDKDSWFSEVAIGGKYTRSRPSKGDTHRFTVELLKRGKPAKKSLHFQVYGMENGKYELNAYVN